LKNRRYQRGIEQLSTTPSIGSKESKVNNYTTLTNTLLRIGTGNTSRLNDLTKDECKSLLERIATTFGAKFVPRKMVSTEKARERLQETNRETWRKLSWMIFMKDKKKVIEGSVR